MMSAARFAAAAAVGAGLGAMAGGSIVLAFAAGEQFTYHNLVYHGLLNEEIRRSNEFLGLTFAVGLACVCSGVLLSALGLWGHRILRALPTLP